MRNTEHNLSGPKNHTITNNPEKKKQLNSSAFHVTYFSTMLVVHDKSPKYTLSSVKQFSANLHAFEINSHAYKQPHCGYLLISFTNRINITQV
jgi:hypothetical protein